MTNPTGDEPTPPADQGQPPGWWQQEAQQQPPAPPPAPPPAHAGPGYGGPAYGGPWHGAPPPGGPGYPYAPAPEHPQATTALVFGIVAVAGFFICLVPVVLSPVAWVIGGRTVKEIDRFPGRYSGRGQAQAGRILGIVGTVVLALAVVGLALFVTLVAISGFEEPGSQYSQTEVWGGVR